MLRVLHRLVPLALLVLALGLKLEEPPQLAELRLTVFDTYQRLWPREYQAAPVRVVDIDEESLGEVGQWPWSRRTLAELVARLFNNGAAVVGFDLIFAEPDRTSPAAMAEQLEGEIESPQLTEELRALPDHDEIFADVIGQTNVVTGYVLTTEENGNTPVEKWGTGFAGDSPIPFLTAYRGAVTSLPELVGAAAGNGHLNALPDIDGVIRRVMLLSRLNDKVYPSLSMEALRVAQGASTYLVKSSNASGVESLGASTGVVSMKVGNIELPTDPEGGYWIHYTGHTPLRFVSASDVLAGKVPQEKLAGHIVIIGSSAAGLKDQRPTPLDPAAPGVEIHAEALEQMILGITLLRPDWAIGAEFAFILVLGLLMILIQPRLGAYYSALLGAVAVTAAMSGSVYAFLYERLLFDPVIPSASVFAVFISAAFFSFLRAERDRNRIKLAFGHYLAPELVRQLADSPNSLKLGGETRDISILFADIRSFTTICEGLTPEEITTLINRFLTPMSDAVLTHKGTIDKYVGDQIMAFWNAPLDDPDHARNACQAALDMRHALIELNVEREREVEEGETFLPLRMGVGINSGPTLVGNMGSEQRFNYSALGDPVNEASRIEGQTKTYGVDILVSELSLTDANQESDEAGEPRFAALEVDLVRLVGLQRPSSLFALIGGPEVAADPAYREWKALHDSMLAAYRNQDWERAESLLAQCRGLETPVDLTKVYDLYAARIARFREEPLDPEWDGVATAERK